MKTADLGFDRSDRDEALVVLAKQGLVTEEVRLVYGVGGVLQDHHLIRSKHCDASVCNSA